MSVMETRVVDLGHTSHTPNWDALVDELELLQDSDALVCVERADEYLDLARLYGDEHAEMRLLCCAAYAHHVLAHDADALETASRAEHLAHTRGDLVWESRALVCQGLVRREIGDAEGAIDQLERALDLRRQTDDDSGTASVLNSLGTVYMSMPHFAPQAARVLVEARRLWTAAGDTDRASIAQTNLAKAYVATSGRLAASNPRGAAAAARHALGIARQSVEEADAAGLSRTGIDARLAVVGALVLAGDLKAAGLALDGTAAMLQTFPSTRQDLSYHGLRGRWLVHVGRLDEAVLTIVDGLDLCAELDRPSERIDLLTTLVDAYEGRGDLRSALTTMREVHELTLELGDATADRRAQLLSSRLDVEAERSRALALEEHNSRLEHEATHDVLTGLPNRRALDVALARWSTEPGRGFACALLDIDHFKRVNDQWSHQVGDHVLARLGTLLHDLVRDGDVAARYGGEEFAILLDGLNDANATDALERIRQAIAAHEWDDLTPGAGLTVSMGVAVHQPNEPIESLLSRADAALYEVKHNGRNGVRLAR
ncbi:GGDEF domain-containing protein [Sanguibacter antarcticus]|uniref:Diguanylate cyclase (GGDEF)-like protein n=1 Tax=Sanguibacter antarcticus TaxID=372484 RepID=A0A2A9E7Z0_9MICO|nr:GGDEF domain-containing protein [Sanguibacter antarcticus]PFG35177.1 diguanylate cyclase (GGDEF)-like protein [Sanguibacter antarcticus]